MVILALPAADVQVIETEPTALDRAYAAESSPFADEAIQCEEPTPDEALGEPWWDALPWSVDLDTPVEELLAAEPEAIAVLP